MGATLMPTPWFVKYNDSFLKTPGQNDAGEYAVAVEYRTDAAYQVIGVHHLDQSENRGNHHIWVEVLDAKGKRVPNAVIAWTWQGRKETTPLLVTCDKPADEPAGNIPLQHEQTVSLWVWTLNEYGSDRVTGLHTRWRDEPPGNTWGHHSFYVVFQHGAAPATLPTDPGNAEPPLGPTPTPDPTKPGQGEALDVAKVRSHLLTIQTATSAIIGLLGTPSTSSATKNQQ